MLRQGPIRADENKMKKIKIFKSLPRLFKRHLRTCERQNICGGLMLLLLKQLLHSAGCAIKEQWESETKWEDKRGRLEGNSGTLSDEVT